MKIIVNPIDNMLDEILERPLLKLKNIKKIVKPILKNVKEKGDRALIKYALEYDSVSIDSVLVSKDEIEEAQKEVSEDLKKAIKTAYKNIYTFHNAQKSDDLVVETMEGVVCKRKSVPIEKVGLYVPGGSAPLFSTVLMLAIPAKIAGCRQIVLCTPPQKNGEIHPAILYAAHISGIDIVIKAGGAQAIAAMAFGTASVPAVYKILGPGNQYVTAAKQIVSEKGVAIDFPAGPSEVAVYADKTAVPEFVAADLLAQAEHGPDSQVLLITTKKKIAENVIKELEKQLEKIPRRRVAEKSIENSMAIIASSKENAIDILNRYAAEHLILSVKDPEETADKIFNAGSVFLGNYTPESAGDYASGTNHTLPTNKSALAYSGVSLDSFLKKITYQELSEKGIKKLGPTIEIMAENEQLMGHKNAVTIRLDYLSKNNESEKNS